MTMGHPVKGDVAQLTTAGSPTSTRAKQDLPNTPDLAALHAAEPCPADRGSIDPTTTVSVERAAQVLEPLDSPEM